MPDVNIKYNGSSIATMNASGTKTMKTGGKYAAKDIVVEYTKPTPVLQAKTATPSLSQQSITPDSGKDGLSSVTVQAITQQLLASLDADFVAENIKKDVNLFGLLGTLEGGGGAKISTGTFTPASDVLSYQVTHNLGAVPNFALFWQESTSISSSTMFLGVYFKGEQRGWSRSSNGNVFAVHGGTYDISGTSPTSRVSTCYGIAAYAATDSTVKFGNENKSNYSFGNTTFNWIVGVI